MFSFSLCLLYLRWMKLTSGIAKYLTVVRSTCYVLYNGILETLEKLSYDAITFCSVCGSSRTWNISFQQCLHTSLAKCHMRLHWCSVQACKHCIVFLGLHKLIKLHFLVYFQVVLLCGADAHDFFFVNINYLSFNLLKSYSSRIVHKTLTCVLHTG